jgi:hypothetical protein
MTKNMTRKGLAFGAGLALVVSGLGVAPATAAAGDLVSLKPLAGSKLGTFISDSFTLESAISSQVTATETAFKIDNPDQDVLLITLDSVDGTAATAAPNTVDISGFSSTGVHKIISDNQTINDTDDTGQFVIDMKQAGITSLVLSDIESVGAADSIFRITVQPIASVTNAAGTAEVQTITTSIGNSVVYVLDLPGEAARTFTSDASGDMAELLTGLNALVTTAVITSTGNTNLTITYPAASGDVALATFTRDGTAVAVAETTVGANQGTVNFALDEDGIFDIITADTEVALAYGAGDKSVTVTSWVESQAVADFKTVDAAYASLPQTVTWYDPKGVVVIPRVERFNTNLNDDNENLHATLEFNKPINLELFNRAQWSFQVTTGGLPTFAGDTDSLPDEIDIVGLGSAAVNADKFGRYAFTTGQAITVDTSYTVNVHSKLAETAPGVERWYSSTGYSISNGYIAAVDAEVTPLVVDTADVDYDAAAGTNNAFATAKIRAGVKSVTYKSQLSNADATDLKAVSVPMLAVVTNGAFMPTGSSISVLGNASAMTRADEVRMVTGFTDVNGKFEVTVVSAAANKNESYNVQFYVLNNGNFETDGLAGGEVSLIQASYGAADASATSLAAVNSVVAGAEVTVALTVKDQFGAAISKTGLGKQLNVSLEAPDKDDLDVNVAVSADGEASFTFANYLTTGSSDLLTATLYTGTSTDKTVIDTVTVTLYNTGATGAVQVPKTLLGSVTYDDFIADGAKVVAGVTVDPDQDIELTGTIVDANGVGIPAAVVIISAPGMQIQEQGSTKYYMDTHTINANSAGVFDVNLNAHMVNTTGVDVTVTTADGKTATTVVKTYLPEDTGLAGATLNGDNLVFTMDTPANVVMNKTYAVTAKLTDKWGNPVKTSATAVKLQGAGSFELNGVSTEISKDFDANGEALVYLRSVKDIAGPGTLQATLEGATYTALDVSTGLTAATVLRVAETTTNVVTTVWDETVFTNTFSKIVQVLASEADIVTAQKVNAGSFKGYVALYALGYEGQRMSAKVGNDWVIVPAIPAATNDLFRAVEFVGAGVEISVRLYIDRVLVATIPLLTK